MLVLGANSFLGQKIRERNRDWLTSLSLNDLNKKRHPVPVVNCRLNPAYRAEAYQEANDEDLRVARIAHAAGCPFVMLSSRQVYGRMNEDHVASEEQALNPITIYGTNKAITEEKLRRLYGDEPDQLKILRLTNVYGDESKVSYDPSTLETKPRPTFMGIAQHNLIFRKHITLDHSPYTERDFIHVNLAAELIGKITRHRISGTYNLGLGYSTPTGQIALWLIEGYGKGDLICKSPSVVDPFRVSVNALEQKIGRWDDHATRADQRRDIMEIAKTLKGAE